MSAQQKRRPGAEQREDIPIKDPASGFFFLISSKGRRVHDWDLRSFSPVGLMVSSVPRRLLLHSLVHFPFEWREEAVRNRSMSHRSKLLRSSPPMDI